MSTCEEKKCPAWKNKHCTSEWLCPECGTIPGCCVTYGECCDACGRNVEPSKP